jgi:RNA polymerase sigma-70 factor (ECF subfamily)
MFFPNEPEKRVAAGSPLQEEACLPLRPDELGQAYADHAAVLVLYARQWLDRDRAEDVVQACFLKLCDTRDVREPRAWLFRAVRNAALNELRGKRRRQQREQAVARDRQPWFHAEPHATLNAQDVAGLLTTLPEDQRELVILRIWGGFTFAEISEITSSPVSTLHSQYQQALRRLREQVDDPCPKN